MSGEIALRNTMPATAVEETGSELGKLSGNNRKVCILAYDGLCTFEYAMAIEIFAVNRPEFSPWYDCQVVAVDAQPFAGLAMLLLKPKMILNN